MLTPSAPACRLNTGNAAHRLTAKLVPPTSKLFVVYTSGEIRVPVGFGSQVKAAAAAAEWQRFRLRRLQKKACRAKHYAVTD